MVSIYDKAISAASRILCNLYELEKDKEKTSEKHRTLLAATGHLCFTCHGYVDEIINAEKQEKNSTFLPDLEPRNTLNASYYIDETSMTVHLEFDGRLPSRKEMTNGADSYKKTAFKKALMETILFVFRDHQNFTYKQKADLLIYQEYASQTVARDHDNTDIKPVIDCLCLGHMVDDGPDYLRLRLDGAVTGRNHVSLHLTQVE